jgi:hypothetical protein
VEITYAYEASAEGEEEEEEEEEEVMEAGTLGDLNFKLPPTPSGMLNLTSSSFALSSTPPIELVLA